jgi:acetyl esterase/lipase
VTGTTFRIDVAEAARNLAAENSSTMKPAPILRTSLVIFLSLLAAVAGLRAAELAVPENVVFERDIEFANPDNQHLQVNMARPKDGAGPFPAVVCIHGGGFRAGKRESYDKLCLTLAQNGYVAITVTYRLAPAYPFPAAVLDSKSAVRWLRANAAKYHVDPTRIGVTGGSAGGHLSQFLGVTAGVKKFDAGDNLDQSSAVACVVNFYGPSDLTKSYGKSVDAAQVLPLFFAGDLSTKLREHIVGSPLYWVTPNAAPTLVVHGTEDKFVAYEQAGWMVDKLKASAVEAELLTLEGAGHGFKGADAEKAEKALIEFFGRHLKPAR